MSFRILSFWEFTRYSKNSEPFIWRICFIVRHTSNVYKTRAVTLRHSYFRRCFTLTGWTLNFEMKRVTVENTQLMVSTNHWEFLVNNLQMKNTWKWEYPVNWGYRHICIVQILPLSLMSVTCAIWWDARWLVAFFKSDWYGCTWADDGDQFSGLRRLSSGCELWYIVTRKCWRSSPGQLNTRNFYDFYIQVWTPTEPRISTSLVRGRGATITQEHWRVGYRLDHVRVVSPPLGELVFPLLRPSTPPPSTTTLWEAVVPLRNAGCGYNVYIHAETVQSALSVLRKMLVFWKEVLRYRCIAPKKS